MQQTTLADNIFGCSCFAGTLRAKLGLLYFSDFAERSIDQDFALCDKDISGVIQICAF